MSITTRKWLAPPGGSGFALRMRVEMFDPGTDAGKGQFLYHCYLAGQPRDDPGGPVLSQPLFTGWITTGWDGTGWARPIRRRTRRTC